MGMQGVHLRTFKAEELLLDQDETRRVLIFFFPTEETKLNTVEMSDALRSFAQGLMVEAIDASYAIGWIELTFDFIKPRPSTKDVKKSIQKILKEAPKYWFKHRKNNNLLEAEVYEIVRKQLSFNFGRYFQDMLTAKPNGIGRSVFFAFVNYQSKC